MLVACGLRERKKRILTMLICPVQAASRTTTITNFHARTGVKRYSVQRAEQKQQVSREKQMSKCIFLPVNNSFNASSEKKEKWMKGSPYGSDVGTSNSRNNNYRLANVAKWQMDTRTFFFWFQKQNVPEWTSNLIELMKRVWTIADIHVLTWTKSNTKMIRLNME